MLSSIDTTTKVDLPSKQFENWAEEQLADDYEFYLNTILLDEAHFHLGGYMNKQNWLILGKQNHHVDVE